MMTKIITVNAGKRCFVGTVALLRWLDYRWRGCYKTQVVDPSRPFSLSLSVLHTCGCMSLCTMYILLAYSNTYAR